MRRFFLDPELRAHTKTSDIDIAVRGVKDFSFLEEKADEIPALYKVDLINLDVCAEQLLREDIEKYRHKVYEKV